MIDGKEPVQLVKDDGELESRGDRKRRLEEYYGEDYSIPIDYVDPIDECDDEEEPEE
jgi:hypothetical protein